MKFTIKTNTLLGSVQEVMPAVAKKTATPALEFFLLEAEKNCLYITGTNQNITICTETTDAQVDDPGAVLIQAKELYALLKTFKTNNIMQFELNEDNLQMKIATVKGNYKLNCMAADEFPVVEKWDDLADMKKEFEVLTHKIKMAGSVSSNDEFRQAMRGVYIEYFGDKVKFTGTDSFRLISLEDNLKSEAVEPISFILPKEAVEILPDTGSNVRLIRNEDGNIIKAVFNMSAFTRMVTTVVREKFPPYKTIISDYSAYDSAEFYTDELIEAITRVTALKEDGDLSNGIIFDVKEDGTMVSLMQNSEKAGEKILSDGSLKMRFGMSSVYLLGILKELNKYHDQDHPTENKVKFFACDPVKPIYLESNVKLNGVFLLMPMKITGDK